MPDFKVNVLLWFNTMAALVIATVWLLAGLQMLLACRKQTDQRVLVSMSRRGLVIAALAMAWTGVQFALAALNYLHPISVLLITSRTGLCILIFVAWMTVRANVVPTDFVLGSQDEHDGGNQASGAVAPLPRADEAADPRHPGPAKRMGETARVVHHRRVRPHPLG